MEKHVVDLYLKGDEHECRVTLLTDYEEETAKQIVNLLAERKHSICSAADVLHVCELAIRFSKVDATRKAVSPLDAITEVVRSAKHDIEQE